MTKKKRLQLPVLRKKRSKDAARAVKRKDELILQRVNTETLNELLNLPGLWITHFATEKGDEIQYLHLFCEHRHAIAMCPECQQVTDRIHEITDRSVRHLDIWGMQTIVHFPQRRFECPTCGKPFSESLTWIEPQRRQTQAFELYIYAQIEHKTPRSQVAQAEGLHEETVRRIFQRQAVWSLEQRETPPVTTLGVDEITLLKGQKQYVLVLSDLERHCVIAVLPDRRKETFVTWLQQLTPEERQAIQVVSMDMWRPYRQAVRQVLPHAQIVADRFHVVKQLHHQIDLLRRRMQRKAKKNEAESLYQALKGSRWILLKPRHELNEDQEAQLKTILAISDELRSIYLLKEEFRTICDKITERSRAERFLQAWICKARATGHGHLLKFIRTLQNWWHEFLNYFDDRVTQGFVEGINRAIRGIIHRAFGFHIFDNFRLQVLVECGDR